MEWFFVARVRVWIWILGFFAMDDDLKAALQAFLDADKGYDTAVSAAAEKTGLRQQAELDEQTAAAAANDALNVKAEKRAALESLLDVV
jgi:uncharacterized membrane protein (UPF0182 family)